MWHKPHFNSRPRKEVDLPCTPVLMRVDISTHDLARRSTGEVYFYTDDEGISTHDLARRSTESAIKSLSLVGNFNSRPRKEVDAAKPKLCVFVYTFQLTTSQGGRHIVTIRIGCYRNFNSRPRKEVDISSIYNDAARLIISTHDLARRSTCNGRSN